VESLSRPDAARHDAAEDEPAPMDVADAAPPLDAIDSDLPDSTESDATDATCEGASCPPACENEHCAVSIALGNDHGCLVDIQGAVYCWGLLGPGVLQNAPALVQGIPPAVAVAANDSRTCIVSASGAVACWDALEGLEPTPATVAVSPAPNAIVGSGGHMCAALSDGHVACWGYNSSGELGDGTRNPSSDPVSPDVSQVLSVAVGPGQTCAVLDTGQLSCWGSFFGLSPSPVSAEPRFTSASLGVAGGCAVDGRGAAHCWEGTAAPLEVAGLGGVDRVAVSPRGGHECTLLRDGSVTCWGDNSKGQVTGSPSFAGVASPTPVSGVAGVRGLALGGEGTCVVTRAGHLVCWGCYLEKGSLCDGLGISELTW
jgi:hypothetical protein